MPGTTPPAPAVGAATITPIREFSPITASAYSSALIVSGSRNVLPARNASLSFLRLVADELPHRRRRRSSRARCSRASPRGACAAPRGSARAGTPCSCSSVSRKTSARSRSRPSSSSCLKDSIMRRCELENAVAVASTEFVRYFASATSADRRRCAPARCVRERRVDVDLHERVLAALLARAVQRRDVDPFLGDDAASPRRSCPAGRDRRAAASASRL